MKKILMLLPVLVFLTACNNQTEDETLAPTPPIVTTNEVPAVTNDAPPSPPAP